MSQTSLTSQKPENYGYSHHIWLREYFTLSTELQLCFSFNNHNNSLYFWNLRNAVQQARIISVINTQTEEVHEGVKYCRCWDIALVSEDDKQPNKDDPGSTKN